MVVKRGVGVESGKNFCEEGATAPIWIVKRG